MLSLKNTKAKFPLAHSRVDGFWQIVGHRAHLQCVPTAPDQMPLIWGPQLTMLS